MAVSAHQTLFFCYGVIVEVAATLRAGFSLLFAFMAVYAPFSRVFVGVSAHPPLPTKLSFVVAFTLANAHVGSGWATWPKDLNGH